VGAVGRSHIKKTGVLFVLLGVKKKKAVLVALRVLSLKRFPAGAFAVPFRVLNRKKICQKIFDR